MATTPVPVFISFDYDHDDDLRTMLVGQSKHDDTPFFISDWSIKDASSDWKEKARARIKRAEQVIVICGLYTDSATGVNVEIRIARELDTIYFLLAGRAAGANKKPTAALPTDKLYDWTWDNLKKLIHGSR